jgi:dTDP-4-dehydrorhamnose 3,5-epimerase
MVSGQSVEMEEIHGSSIIAHACYRDVRGLFRVISRDRQFVQLNLSRSKQGVFRGLHYQKKEPQGKLITCLSGEILDFGLDLRRDSPTYGQLHALFLSGRLEYSVYWPPGIAHGFYSMTNSEIVYQCTTPYDAESDTGVNILSPSLGLDRALSFKNLILSDRDLKLPKFIRGETFV